MFIEHINKNILFHDNENKYNYDDLIRYVKLAQYNIKKVLDKPSVIGFCSQSSFFELVSILSFLELGHKILFVPKKHIFYYEIHNDFFNELDLIVDLIGDEINTRGHLIINQDFLFESNENDELEVEYDDLKTGFVFLSSGTTGKPKVIEQTHRRLIYAANQTINRIWVDNNNFLLHRGNTINHLGIFTTTYLPALFVGQNVSWYSHVHINEKVVVSHSDGRLIYNATLLFPYQPKELINQIPLIENSKIITGGTTITEEFIEELFKNEKIDSIFNVYGATEIITPIMWNHIRRDTIERDFIMVSDGLVVNLDKNNQIISIGGFVDTDRDIEIPDALKKHKDGFKFIGRKQQFLYRPIKKIKDLPTKNQVHNITLNEDELIKILSDSLGEFVTPIPIIIKNGVDNREKTDYFLIYDPELHANIHENDITKLNEIVYIYYGITPNHLEYPLLTNMIPIENLPNFNNGLKLDRGLIKKTIINKINKTIKTNINLI